MDEALEHCSRGASIWKFATNREGGEPDVVLACAGDRTNHRNLRGLVAFAEVCSRHQGAGCECSGLDRIDEPR